jgi:hypothetical protein
VKSDGVFCFKINNNNNNNNINIIIIIWVGVWGEEEAFIKQMQVIFKIK